MVGGLLLAAISGCAAGVKISSTTRLQDAGPIESVGFVIYQLNTSTLDVESLRKVLLAETTRRGITARATIMTGTELDEDDAFKTATKGMNGMIVITPTGGTLGSGGLIRALHDVRAYKWADGERLVMAWQGEVDTFTGASGNQLVWQRLLAKELVGRLIQDGVLPDLMLDAGTRTARPPPGGANRRADHM